VAGGTGLGQDDAAQHPLLPHPRGGAHPHHRGLGGAAAHQPHVLPSERGRPDKFGKGAWRWRPAALGAAPAPRPHRRGRGARRRGLPPACSDHTGHGGSLAPCTPTRPRHAAPARVAVPHVRVELPWSPCAPRWPAPSTRRLLRALPGRQPQNASLLAEVLPSTTRASTAPRTSSSSP
jgi:hypothetical protein